MDLLELLRAAGTSRGGAAPKESGNKNDPRVKLKKWGLIEDTPMWKLMEAVLVNREPKVREILTEHPELVNAVYSKSKGRTPLIRAFESGRFNLARTLLEFGADPEVTIPVRDCRQPILHVACVARAFGMIRLLLDAGADIHSKDTRGNTLLEAILLRITMKENDPLPVFRMMIEEAEKRGQPFDLNKTDPSGDTLLFSAVAYRFTAIVDYLIRKGVDLNIQNQKGMTALHMATTADFQDIVDLLLMAGASTETCDHDGATPIVSAGPTRRSLIANNFIREYERSGRKLTPRDHPRPKEASSSEPPSKKSREDDEDSANNSTETLD